MGAIDEDYTEERLSDYDRMAKLLPPVTPEKSK